MVPGKTLGLVNSRAEVVAVCRSDGHGFSKLACNRIDLIAGFGVDGDAHAGQTVQHRSRVRLNPSQPNLRQVHLIQTELFEELARKGFSISPGDLGENIATSGIDLLGLSRDTLLNIGDSAILRVTGLRNPCAQIEAFAPGLLRQVVEKTGKATIRKAGIMAIVEHGGAVRPGDAIVATAPAGPHIPLERV